MDEDEGNRDVRSRADVGRLHRLGHRGACRPRAVGHRRRRPPPRHSRREHPVRARSGIGQPAGHRRNRDNATSTFTIHTAGGTIGGRGSGKLHPGEGGYDSFGGTCAVTHGTGRFRGASGVCGLYGSIYRVEDSLRVQVTGKLRY
jgi:hypothetical protein